jgi:DNA-binding response OmpR family regulator
MMGTRVLIVEDDPSLGFVVKDNLSAKGYLVTLCRDGEEGIKTFHQGSFDLCILDVMMPKKDGFSVARSIREKNSDVPILFLTAKSMVADKVEGFRAGGDDYIVKPFSMEELCLRMEVFLRRSVGSGESSSFVLGECTFDYKNLTLRHPNQDKTLTQKEADVLRLLCLHRDRVLKREEKLKAVWGDDDYFMGRSLDVFLSKLRKYLLADPRVEIINYHGVGFKLEIRS